MDPTAPEFLARCAQIGTSTWSDALDEFAIAGVVRGLTVRSGHGRFAAMAVTARQTIGELGNCTKSEIAVGRMIDAVGPGQVLLVDMGGAEVSALGGLAAAAVQAKQVAAVILDGACRDLAEIRATGL